MRAFRKFYLAVGCAIVAVVGVVNLFAEENSTPPDSEYVRAYKQFIEHPPIIKSLKARVETRGISYMFLSEDITNLESFAVKLKQPAAMDLVSHYLRTNFSKGGLDMLSNYYGGVHLELRQTLADELTRIINNGTIYNSNRFAGVSLSPETAKLVGKKWFGPDEIRYNRLLLLDAYPNELSNDRHPKKKEVFLEIRYQTNGFYVKTATNLDGLADSFVRPVPRAEIFAGGSRSDSLAAGWYETNLWKVANGVLETDSLSEQMWLKYCSSNQNPVILQSPLFLASRVMNLGIPSEKIATLKWSGGNTKGTDHFGNPFSAELQVDSEGRPAGLKEVYPQYWASGGVTQALEVAVSYQYDHPITDWALPTEIRIGTNWLAEILSVEPSPRPLDESAFEFNRFINKKSGLRIILTRRNEKEVHHARYDDLKHGQRRLAGIWVTNEQLHSWGFILFCVLTGGIVGAGIAMEKKRTKTSTNKIT